MAALLTYWVMRALAFDAGFSQPGVEIAGVVEETTKFVAASIAGFGVYGFVSIAMFQVYEAILYADFTWGAFWSTIASRTMALPMHLMWYFSWMALPRKYIYAGLAFTVLAHGLWNYGAAESNYYYLGFAGFTTLAMAGLGILRMEKNMWGEGEPTFKEVVVQFVLLGVAVLLVLDIAFDGSPWQ